MGNAESVEMLCRIIEFGLAVDPECEVVEAGAILVEPVVGRGAQPDPQSPTL